MDVSFPVYYIITRKNIYYKNVKGIVVQKFTICDASVLHSNDSSEQRTDSTSQGWKRNGEELELKRPGNKDIKWHEERRGAARRLPQT